MIQVLQHVLLPRSARLRVVYLCCGPKALPGNKMCLPSSLSELKYVAGGGALQTEFESYQLQLSVRHTALGR